MDHSKFYLSRLLLYPLILVIIKYGYFLLFPGILTLKFLGILEIFYGIRHREDYLFYHKEALRGNSPFLNIIFWIYNESFRLIYHIARGRSFRWYYLPLYIIQWFWAFPLRFFYFIRFDIRNKELNLIASFDTFFHQNFPKGVLFYKGRFYANPNFYKLEQMIPQTYRQMINDIGKTNTKTYLNDYLLIQIKFAQRVGKFENIDVKKIYYKNPNFLSHLHHYGISDEKSGIVSHATGNIDGVEEYKHTTHPWEEYRKGPNPGVVHSKDSHWIINSPKKLSKFSYQKSISELGEKTSIPLPDSEEYHNWKNEKNLEIHLLNKKYNLPDDHHKRNIPFNSIKDIVEEGAKNSPDFDSWHQDNFGND